MAAQRIGVFGWGIIAPRSPDVDAFAANLRSAESWLSPFDGFGPDNFLVGKPEFRFDDYRPWIEERFKPTRFQQLERKMGWPVKYAIGAFIQSLRQNPGIEQELRRLETRARVYVATAGSDLQMQYEQSVSLYRSLRRWRRFWSDPARNEPLRAYLRDPAADGGEPPPDPRSVSEDERDLAEDAWWTYWSERSPELRRFLEELREIESASVVGDVESAKLAVIREKRGRLRTLQERWGTPDPPWEAVSANYIWNINNVAAAQVSILGGITGMAICPAAACASFGVALKLAMDAIRSGEAVAVVVGATDPPPHPLSVGAFYNARVISADRRVSKPLTDFRGTHVAGGAAVWIVADLEHMTARGFRPLGMEPLAVGATSDADHIITPSREGPRRAVELALEAAASGEAIGSWDLHSTATPADLNEVELLLDELPADVLLSARKGTFGHGMSVAGGWELTAQYLGYERGEIPPTPLQAGELNAQIARLHRRFVFDAPVALPAGLAGKLSMGIGGTNACVLSRPWPRGDGESRA
jgi:hypothetical protein